MGASLCKTVQPPAVVEKHKSLKLLLRSETYAMYWARLHRMKFNNSFQFFFHFTHCTNITHNLHPCANHQHGFPYVHDHANSVRLQLLPIKLLAFFPSHTNTHALFSPQKTIRQLFEVFSNNDYASLYHITIDVRNWAELFRQGIEVQTPARSGFGTVTGSEQQQIEFPWNSIPTVRDGCYGKVCLLNQHTLAYQPWSFQNSTPTANRCLCIRFASRCRGGDEYWKRKAIV